jgi:sugar phosphate isomerase/epimerase
VKLACQEKLLSSGSVFERWEQAQRFGFDGIELIGDAGLAARWGELRAARARGAMFSSVCLASDRFIGDFDVERRRQARDHIKRLLSVIAELNGAGAITPAAWGMWSNALPHRSAVPRSPEEDHAILLETLDELGEYAAELGVQLFFEPLNRYEDHMVNRLDQGRQLVKACGRSSVRLLADLYHMNIEEADPIAALRSTGDWVGHIHASDSNRLEPGKGHIDWGQVRAALQGIHFDGWVAIECRLSDAPEFVLPTAVKEVRGTDV